MTDSELARVLVARHQTVNQAARQLAAAGQITRTDQGRGLVNAVGHRIENTDAENSMALSKAPRSNAYRVPPLPPPGSIALVGCVSKKVTHPAPAGELYASTLFKREREWATARCDKWFILSAKHGLLRPERVIEPYDETLKGQSAARKQVWSARVLEQLVAEFKRLTGLHFEIYAGADYYDYGLIHGLMRAGATDNLPWEGLGLGQRVARTEYSSDG